MTSTNIQVGIGSSEKLTSRVLKPPGGGHTNIFGPPEPEVPKRNRRHDCHESSVTLGGEVEPAQKSLGVAEAPKIDNSNGNSEIKDDSPAVHEEKASQNGRQDTVVDNAETIAPEKPKEPEQVKAAPAEAPRRVRVPPGGFSSGLW